MTNSDEINRYISYKCVEIPREDFAKIMYDLLEDASYKMDSKIPGNITEFANQILWVIKKSYSLLPLSKLIEAFHQGSLGEIGGTVKLSIRNINIWLKEINHTWGEGSIARSNRERMDQTDIMLDQCANPNSAAAYSLRIKWGCSKRISHQQWDHLTSKHRDMVAMLDKGTPLDNMHPGLFLSDYVATKYSEEDFVNSIASTKKL